MQGGAGGDGSVSFRREAHVPKGGPDGGDGGRGGAVELVCDDSRRDLSEFHRGAHFRAKRGGHGEGSQRHGATAPALEVRVPPGTVAEDAERDARWDLLRPGQRAVVARGGPGGRGNKSFAHATRQTPRMAERGLPGDEGWVELRLKLLADAGLVGLPNAGKSSLLARLTAARPKVADYPFTTIDPVLGTIETDDRQVVRGRHPRPDRGRHATAPGWATISSPTSSAAGCWCTWSTSRRSTAPTRAPTTRRSRRSFAATARASADLPRILCLSKSDLVTADEVERAIEDWREHLGDASLGVVATSAATGAGLDRAARARSLRAVPPTPAESEPAAEVAAEHRVYRPGSGEALDVTRTAPGAFRVAGERVERLHGPPRHRQRGGAALRGGPAAVDGGDPRPGGGRLRAGRRRGDRRHGLRARPRRAAYVCRSHSSARPPGRPASRARAARSACGGGGNSDEENVEQVVRDFAEATSESDGDRFCKEIITREFLEQTTGAKGDRAEEQCAKQIDALKGADIEIVDIKSTKVNGDKATVTAELKQQGQTGQQTFNLQREDGDFRLTSSTP